MRLYFPVDSTGKLVMIEKLVLGGPEHYRQTWEIHQYFGQKSVFFSTRQTRHPTAHFLQMSSPTFSKPRSIKFGGPHPVSCHQWSSQDRSLLYQGSSLCRRRRSQRLLEPHPRNTACWTPHQTWLIKQLLRDLAETIAKMCNMSLEEGIFPSSLKSTIVRPRLKKTNLDPEDLNSFRPISNLTFLSKTVERAVAIRFVEHSELHKLLPRHQSAYRSSHSRETAVLAVHNDLVRTIDSGNISALVLLDLSAAFDTVDHSIMLQVLRDRFCVEGRALEWFESYLCDRMQTYQVKDQQSRPRKVDCGVPQGSVLGPQKFIAYTEDLAELIDQYCLNHHMYADDTQMIEQTTVPGIPGTITKLQSCIEATQEWCKSRRLQLNPAKTELIWFESKANLKKMADLDLNLYIGADVIKPVSVVRDLGVFLDSELSMRHHINTVIRSCFFSSSASKISSTHPRRRGYLRPGVSLRDNQAGLL